MSADAVGPSTKPPTLFQKEEDEAEPQKLSDKMAKLTEELQTINASFRCEVDKLLSSTESYKNVQTLSFESYDLRTKSLLLQKIQNDLDITTRKIAKLQKKFQKMANHK